MRADECYEVKIVVSPAQLESLLKWVRRNRVMRTPKVSDYRPPSMTTLLTAATKSTMPEGENAPT